LPSAPGNLTYLAVPGAGDYGLWLTEDLLSTTPPLLLALRD
jgi:hypothetical protein